jgi:hypothetical protein
MMPRYRTATRQLARNPMSAAGDAVSAVAVNISCAVFPRRCDEDGAAARIALEPVDTERVLHRCHILHYALSSHAVPSSPSVPVTAKIMLATVRDRIPQGVTLNLSIHYVHIRMRDAHDRAARRS